MAILGVNKWDGSIVYYTNTSGGKTYPWPDSTSGGGGGASGGGGIWSSVEQIIWIKYDGAPAYPVYVKPGYNDIRFWIPTIFPDDIWIEAKLEIEAPSGYILIPAGFEWDIITGEDVPPPPPNSKRIDKIKFRDYYDVVINYIPPPPTGDPNIDEITYDDVYDTDIRTILTLNESVIDEFNFDDIHDVDVNTIHTEQINNIDNFRIIDIKNIDMITPIPPGGPGNIDDISYDDLVDTVKRYINTLEDKDIDNMSYNDLVDTLKRYINTLNNSDIDNSNYTDVYDIELN